MCLKFQEEDDYNLERPVFYTQKMGGLLKKKRNGTYK
jgi:hypothetical protein